MESNVMSQDISKLAEALSKAQGIMQNAEKNGKNPFHKSSYTTLSSVWESCRQALSENGLSVIQTIDMNGDKIILITTLAHSSGQWIRSILPLFLGKMDSQSIGSAITYSRRYALSAIVGVCPEEDDDAEYAMGRHPYPKKVGHVTPITLDKEQVEMIKNLIKDRPNIREEVLKLERKNLIQDIEKSRYPEVISTINEMIKKGA